MDHAPRVSIVIAAFNAADTLEEALTSVAAQTYRDFELVVVDDGSTDATPVLLAKYAAMWPWMKWVRQDNAGVSVARNRAIEMARSEFIAFLDADDVWLPDKLALQVPLFDRNSATALVYTDMTDWPPDPALAPSLFRDKHPVRGRVLQRLLIGCFVLTSTVVVKKSAVQRIGGFVPGQRLFEDVDMFLRLAEYHDFDYVDKVLVRRLVRPESLSHRDPLANQLRDLEIFGDWVARRPDLFPEDAPEVRDHRAKVYMRMGRTLLSRHDWAGSRHAYRRAIALGQRSPGVLVRAAAAYLPALARLYWLAKAARGHISRGSVADPEE
jgi:glycosyltransferase involved in cell wall biosynthesis